MGLPQPKEPRKGLRRPLLGDLTGRLLIGWSGRAVPCLAIDVSASGLRVLAREELARGTAMFLAFDRHNIALEVLWSQPDGRSRGSYACGLTTTDGADLEKFFVSIGWLEDSEETAAWARGLDLVNLSEE